MALSDSQIATIIDQIQSGKPLKDLVKLYDDPQEVVEIYEFFAFLEAQRLEEKPDPSGLRSALSHWDDEPAGSSWQQWISSWRWFMGGSLSFALLFFMFSPWEAPTETLVVTEKTDSDLFLQAMPRMARSGAPEMEMAMMSLELESVVAPASEMEVLLNQLESDFESEFAEYQNLKESVMPLVSEELFSAQIKAPIDAL